jgi:GT2 family glycosyltransferase
MTAEPKMIIITPAFEDAEAFSQLLAALAEAFSNAVFVIAVDDGSIRKPLMMSAFEESGVAGEIIKLRRNVGHQQAIAVGLAHATEQYKDDHRVVIMDSDGEDMPASIPDLLRLLDDPETDAVVAQRKARVETIRFKVFYQIYKLIFRILTGKSINFGNFMALKPHAVKRLAAMQEVNLHVPGALIASRQIENEFRQSGFARFQGLDGVRRKRLCPCRHRLCPNGNLIGIWWNSSDLIEDYGVFNTWLVFNRPWHFVTYFHANSRLRVDHFYGRRDYPQQKRGPAERPSRLD